MTGLVEADLKVGLFLLLILISAPAIDAQAPRPSEPPSFQTVSIEPSTGGMIDIQYSPRNFTARSSTVLELIVEAYGLNAWKIFGGPDWVRVGRFTIRAATDTGVTPDQKKLMLQTLLAERIQLQLAPETQTVPLYRLTAGNVRNLKASANPNQRSFINVKETGIDEASQRWEARNTTMGRLTCLVTHPGVVISKETLIDAGWGGLAVSENSLDQAISRLRKLLGDGRKHATYIETIPLQGYRFRAPVERATRDGIDAPLETQLAPFRAVMQARTELETLDRNRIGRARQVFEEAVRDAPDYVAAHVGLAMACGLLFKASTPDAEPDAAALELGIQQGRDACAMAPQSGKAWSALGFLLYLNGDTEQAAAAATRAVTLEPDLWRHAILAAYVTWGDDRLHAARRALTLCPGLALAHWLRATVFIARGVFEPALEELRAGCAAQDAQKKGAEFPAVGLHLLHGLVLAAHGRLDEAAAELRRELPSADSGQLYARECAANTWYAIGAVCLRQRKRAEADAAFKRALTIHPGHVSAAAALRGDAPAARRSLKGPAEAGYYVKGPPEGGHYRREMDAALGQAIVLARGNRNADAARVYGAAIAQAPRGSVGWLLPVEPLLHRWVIARSGMKP